MTALVAAACERGGTKFRAHVLPDSEPMKLLLQALDSHATPRTEDGIRVYEPALPEPSPEAVTDDPMYRLLKLAAEGLEMVFKALSLGGRRVNVSRSRRRAPES